MAGWSSAAAVPLVVRSTAGIPVSQSQAQGHECRRSFVETHVDGHVPMGGQRQGQRGGPRSRAHDGMLDPGADPFVDQRGRVGRLHVTETFPPFGVVALAPCRYAHRQVPTWHTRHPRHPHRGGHRRPTAAETVTRLSTETTGSGPRLVLAHGFTQTGGIWGPMADDLATDHQVVSVDMPGHGRSSAVRADLSAGARLLVDAGGTGTYLGYSMGARFCLPRRTVSPDRVRSLILISGTAGIEDDRLRMERLAADESLASDLDPLPGEGPAKDERERLDAFLRRWLDRPLFAGIPDGRSGLAERRMNTTAGLASSLRLAGTGTQRPLWDQLHLLSMPVLVITGERDTKFTALGARMAEAIGANAIHAVVPGVGHTAHLEDPGAVTAVVRAHLAAGPG